MNPFQVRAAPLGQKREAGLERSEIPAPMRVNILDSRPPSLTRAARTIPAQSQQIQGFLRHEANANPRAVKTPSKNRVKILTRF
jgi:hypothetical protein